MRSRRNSAIAALANYAKLVHGDLLASYNDPDNIPFCFLDCEKHLYEQCFDVVGDELISGGVLIADNAVSHCESLKTMIDKAQADTRFDRLTVPI